MQKEVPTYRPKPDGAIDPAGEAGWFLQREREMKALTLEDVAKATGIHPHHLSGIESGDLTSLPARAETLRMVATYAEHLELDPQPLVLHYARFLPDQSRALWGRRHNAPKVFASAKIIDFSLARRIGHMTTRGSGFIASICGAIILFGIASWMFSPAFDFAGSKAPETVAASEPAVEPQAQAPEERREGTVASITAVTETPLPDAPAKDVPPATETAEETPESLDGLAALIEQEVASEARAGQGQAPALGEGGKVYGAENRDSRLVLKAKAPVWIRIEDGKGNVIITQTLMAGDSYRVPNQEGLVIIARDGGLLGIEIDGSPKGTLGQPGEILVGRTLDIAKLAQKG